MNYVLIEVESNGNADRHGGSDRHYHRAMSTNKEALIDYCKETYDKEIGQPKPFTWDNYFIINESPIVILSGDTTQYNSVSREDCYHYDLAQGKHFCYNPSVKAKRCVGLCKEYMDKRKPI